MNTKYSPVPLKICEDIPATGELLVQAVKDSLEEVKKAQSKFKAKSHTRWGPRLPPAHAGRNHPPANIAALGSLVAAIGKTIWAAATVDAQRTLSQIRAAARPYIDSMQSMPGGSDLAKERQPANVNYRGVIGFGTR